MNIVHSLPPILDSSIPVAIDTEWTGQVKERLHRPHGIFACMSIAIDDDVYVIQDENDVPSALWRIRNGLWIMQNAVYDIRQLRKITPIEPRYIWDTMLMEKGLWGGYYSDFALDHMARRYLNVRLDKGVRASFGNTQGQLTQEQIHYAAHDANITLKLYECQHKIAHREEHMDVYNKVDMPMIWVILDMPPVRIDAERWITMVQEFELRGKQIEEEIGVNVYSHQKVKDLIYQQTGLRLEDTQAETLEGLNFPVTEKILLTRMLRKATSTYGEKWIEKNVEEYDLVYANFNIIGAATGRMSCSNPNLQQIPIRRIPEYRELFIPQFDILLDTDVMAQEPHILAWHSKDKELKRIFEEGLDVHLEVARAATGDMLMEKSDPRRSNIGKKLNLATSYGMSALGLSRATGKTMAEAESFLAGYFRRFKGVKAYIDRQHSFAASKGYVTTALGRRVWVNPHHQSANNISINAPIQGGAADFTKRWAVLFHEACLHNKYRFPLTMMVHDELVCDVKYEEQENITGILKQSFDKTAEELYPGLKFEAEILTGKNWKECH